MTGQSCAGCRFARPLDSRQDLAECRRHAPRLVTHDEHQPMAEWPLIKWSDWCGEFQVRTDGTAWTRREMPSPAESAATGEAAGAASRPRYHVAAVWREGGTVDGRVQDGYALIDREKNGERVNQWLLSQHPGMTLEEAETYAHRHERAANERGSD